MTKYVTQSLLLFGLVSISTVAFQPASKAMPAVQLSSTIFESDNMDESQISSRRGFFQEIGVISSVTAGVFLVGKTAAFADEEAVEESFAGANEVSGILQSANLRSLKRAEKQLTKLEFYAVENDYEQLKLAIRNAPFSEVRKNSFAIIKEFAKDKPGSADKLNASYETFIASLEKMDSTASLGMRGRNLEKSALLQAYQATASSLASWIQVVTEVAEGS